MLHTPRAVYRDYTPAGSESRRRMIFELKLESKILFARRYAQRVALKVGQAAGRLLACAIRSLRRTVFKDNLSPIQLRTVGGEPGLRGVDARGERIPLG